MADSIFISKLQLTTHIGVPDAERAAPQKLLVSVEIEVDSAPAAKSDSVAHTVDYAAVAEKLKKVAAERPRKLIETLAEDLAAVVLAFPNARAVRLTLEKFILPDTEAVGIRIERRNP